MGQICADSVALVASLKRLANLEIIFDVAATKVKVDLTSRKLTVPVFLMKEFEQLATTFGKLVQDTAAAKVAESLRLNSNALCKALNGNSFASVSTTTAYWDEICILGAIERKFDIK